jgi:hypothetical protein
MREVLHNGPLDIVRRRVHEATELDDIADEYIGAQFDPITGIQIAANEPDARTCKNRHKEMHEAVLALDKDHPLIGHRVAIFGSELTPGVDATGKVRSLAQSVERLSGVRQGVYLGHNLKKVYDPTTNKISIRVVHDLKGETFDIWDELGDHNRKTRHDFVCVTGSELVPEAPLNAHSLKDLSDDRVAKAIDLIAFNASLSLYRKLKAFHTLARRFLAVEGHRVEINRQRLSYLNSLELVAGAVINTSDLLFIDEDQTSGDANVVGASNPANILGVLPRYFQTDVAYRRSPDGSTVAFNDKQKQIHVYGALFDGRSVLAPLRSIVSVS